MGARDREFVVQGVNLCSVTNAGVGIISRHWKVNISGWCDVIGGVNIFSGWVDVIVCGDVIEIANISGGSQVILG